MSKYLLPFSMLELALAENSDWDSLGALQLVQLIIN